MTRAQAHAINDAAHALQTMCRRYGAGDALRAHAMNAARLSDEAVDALAPTINAEKEQAA